jgi:folate-binding Fe-S cluster repair protein YgfZ
MTTDNSYEILTREELSNALDKDVTSNNFKTAAKFLYNAVNDWPTFNLDEPTDLLAELKKDIRGKLTYTNIVNYSKQLDLSVDAWKAEATSSLLEMFDFERKNVFDKKIELESIIAKITKHYRQD